MDKTIDNPLSQLKKYELRHLVTHLIGAQMWESVYKIMTDFNFMEVKIGVLSVFDLQEDLRNSLSLFPAPHDKYMQVLKALKRAIDYERKNLEKSPAGIFQQIYNHIYYSGSPTIEVDIVMKEKENLINQRGHLWFRRQFPIQQLNKTLPVESCSSKMNKTFPIKGYTSDNGEPTTSLAFNRDGRFLCVGEIGCLRVWDTFKDKEMFRLDYSEIGWIHKSDELHWRPEKNQIISISRSFDFLVWDLDKERCVSPDFEVNGLLRKAEKLKFEEMTLDEMFNKISEKASGYGNRPHPWPIRFPSNVEEAFRDNILNDLFVFDQTGKSLEIRPYSVYIEELYRKFCTQTSDYHREFDGTPRKFDQIYSIALSPDNRILVVSNDSGRLHGYRIDVWKTNDQPHAPEKLEWLGVLGKDLNIPATYLKFSSDGRIIVAAFEDNSIWLWDMNDYSEPLGPKLLGHREYIFGCAFDTSNQNRFASCSLDGKINIWSLPNRLEQRSIEHFQDEEGLLPIRTIAVHPSRKWLSVSYKNNRIGVFFWDVSNDTVYKLPLQRIDRINCTATAFSPNGTELAIVNNNEIRTVRLYRKDKRDLEFDKARRKTSINIHTDHEFPITKCLYNSNGDLLAAYSDLSFSVWDLDSGSRWLHIEDDVNPKAPNSFDFSPDNKWLAIGIDEKVLMIDILNSKFVETLQSHERDVKCCAFSPDGSSLVTGSVDGDIRVWSVEELKEKTPPLRCDGGWVLDCTYTLDGMFVVSIHQDKSVRIWRVDTGTEVAKLFVDELNKNVIVLDSSTIAYGDIYGKINVFRLSCHNPGPSVITPSEQLFKISMFCPKCLTKQNYSKKKQGSVQKCKNCGSFIKINPFSVKKLPDLKMMS